MSYGQDPWRPAGPSDPRRRPEQPEADPESYPSQPRTRSRSGSRAAPPPPTPTPPPGGGRRAAGRGAPAPAPADPPSGPGRVNDDLDLDEVDPKGVARRRAAKQAARKSHPRRKKAMKITALVTAGTLVAVCGAGYYVVRHLLGNVQTVSLSSLKNRPAASKANAEGQTPLNILVLGSQTRDGQTQAVHVGNSSKDGTDLSDTAFIVHIAADRKWAEVISIPRDVFVPMPACQDRTDPSEIHPAQSEAQFYDAMNNGGPACAVATVEQMTDIRMDHFLELTFDAFIQLTDAVGGVQICVPQGGIDDPNYSGLVISQGLHTIEGNEALAFVRDRHGLAGGMDTSRIQMQQQFMTSLFNKMTANGTLENPVTLYKIADAISNNITVDPGLDNIGAMAQIAESVGTINKKYIQYVTAPYVLDSPGEYSYDEAGDHLSPGPGFATLWNYVRNDEPLPGSPAAAAFGASSTSSSTTASTQATAPASANPSPTVALKSVTVAVDNGTEVNGEAHNAATNLAALGMNATVGNGGYSGITTTEILYPSGDKAEADTVANEVVGASVRESSSVSEVTLVLGANAPNAIVASPSTSADSDSGGSASTSGSPSPTPSISVEARSGDENICSSLPGDGGQYGGSPTD